VILLLDTDILIDVALQREPFSGPAGDLLDALQARPGMGYVAWHSIANFHYVVRPVRKGSGSREFIADLIKFVQVTPTSTDALRFALELPLPDFEDAMQVAAARACRADAIVTRNTRDYRGSPIPARTPSAILPELPSL
jgi:predicted nucleic acid-binding protein